MLKLVPFLVLFSTSALAANEIDIAVACQKMAAKKIIDQAYNFGCYVDQKAIVTVGYEDRKDETSRYVWYSAEASCADTGVYEIRRLVRYSYENGQCY
ncbi:MAG: hypothetical protein EOP06_17230 [Proteobacteria bacterium]|nr:MAG: hypothetical protein EOP06_17230 [Pseudomonadota bacterium]